MAEFQITPEFFWLGLMILCLVIEAATVGLATIWFAAGALAATAASVLGVGILGQILLFFTVSLVLLTFTRPFALKYISPHKIRTNYEDLVDQTVKITECVDNAADSRFSRAGMVSPNVSRRFDIKRRGVGESNCH